MAFPRQIRLQLGLSQAEFADLLSTSEGQLSMVESGLRNLPDASLRTASFINEALTAVKAQAIADAKPGSKATAFLEKEMRSRQVKINTLQLREEKLTEKKKAASNLLLVMKQLEHFYTGQNDEGIHQQVMLLQRRAGKKMERYETELIQVQIELAIQESALQKIKELSGSQKSY